MSKTIRTKLERAGIDLEHVEITSTREVQVHVMDEDGTVKQTATNRLQVKVSRALGGWGGFRCQHGGWVLQKGYTDRRGDPNDRTSAHHY